MKTLPIAPLLALLLSLPLLGCDDDDPLQHNPPDDQAGLIVVNNTFNEMRVFLDGERIPTVDENDDRAYNLEPGVHRITLDPRNSTAIYQEEIELIQNRSLVLIVNDDGFGDQLFVEMRFD